MTEKEEVKESLDDYEKDERLELEDDETEYDPEEDGGDDYDDKEPKEDIAEEEAHNPEESIAGEENTEDTCNEGEEETEEAPEESGDEGNECDNEKLEDAEAAEEDHHDAFKERRKKKEFEVFVEGLDKDASEDDLKKVFSVVGEIMEVRLIKNPLTKKNKGFAFLRFATVGQAKRAVAELKNPVVNGKKCGVSPSQDSDTLFLGNICKTWTKEALKEKLKSYGVEDMTDLTLVEDSSNEGMNRGFAFLEFSSRSDAMDAFNCLQKKDVSFGANKSPKVSFAESFIDPGDEIMAQVKTVFVDGLHASWDENRVRRFLKKYGAIEKIELARNMPSAKRKDFCFVTFNSHDVAVNCAKSINNAEIGEGDHKAKVRARLSRPLERGRKKYAGGGVRSVRSTDISARDNRGRPAPRSFPVRGGKGVQSRLPPLPSKRQVEYRDRRLAITMPTPSKRRRITPPSRSLYGRRPPVPIYPRGNSKMEYSSRDELPPRSRSAVDYGFTEPLERSQAYRDSYSSHVLGYPDIPRGSSCILSRTAYMDDGYGKKFERPLPSFHEGRAQDYATISGSKRPYAALDGVPPRYVNAGVRYSSSRLAYDHNPPLYGDRYGDRDVGRSGSGYSVSRRSVSNQEPHWRYTSRPEYGRGAYGANESGKHSLSYGGDYTSRGADRASGSSSYSSLYTSRGAGESSSYVGGGSSGSYY
uniref:RRM domain-containing protein n=1 Tax=Kalanchoe fedtschenkoi TaxID=63787 RepID=A0A7N0ZYI6_KALFE